tara:strand:+ start:334 stop:507 length:174 start_codon:yes stop_codon:yes gene_type:complete
MLQALNKSQTSFEDGYLTLVDDQHQAGVKACISRAREVNDKPPALTGDEESIIRITG